MYAQPEPLKLADVNVCVAVSTSVPTEKTPEDHDETRSTRAPVSSNEIASDSNDERPAGFVALAKQIFISLPKSPFEAPPSADPYCVTVTTGVASAATTIVEVATA